MEECASIQFIYQLFPILDLRVPVEWIVYPVIFFAGGIVALLGYIGFYIIRELRKKARYQHLIKIYSNFSSLR